MSERCLEETPLRPPALEREPLSAGPESRERMDIPSSSAACR
eukprot:CAMPEP_0117556920 /NCGR_PEP_ID=MMETSP0784-20121206/52058_1 /TAXON_ID=39447 /ORGANISM="" /LENGTH=41 /DNA_ID= /DNA_START= /DNA_END= /DNA_ORIENTATION=